MTLVRTTARGLLLTVITSLLGAGAAAAAPEAPVPRIVFPVLGTATYTDDFGDPRGQGAHEGNDMLAPRRALALAAEAGTVKFHTTSSRAGCMLYLDGKSGTEYLYIHLNNDLTDTNDNQGSCVPGVAYAKGLKSGAKVAAGEADRLCRRLRRRERDPPPSPLRGAPERRRRDESVPVPEQGAPPALRAHRRGRRSRSL